MFRITAWANTRPLITDLLSRRGTLHVLAQPEPSNPFDAEAIQILLPLADYGLLPATRSDIVQIHGAPALLVGRVSKEGQSRAPLLSALKLGSPLRGVIGSSDIPFSYRLVVPGVSAAPTDLSPCPIQLNPDNFFLRKGAAQ